MPPPQPRHPHVQPGHGLARRDRPALTLGPLAALDADGHRALARQLTAAVWDGLGSDRDAAHDAELVDAAHAALFHWRAAGGTVEVVRGEWLVSRVYAVNGRPEPALHHARRAYELCVAQALGGFDLAYAYEGMARALALAGEDHTDWYARAVAAGEAIGDPDDAAIFAADLDAPPWPEPPERA